MTGIKFFTKKIKNKWEDHTAYGCEAIGRDGRLYRQVVIGDTAAATQYLWDWVKSHPKLDYTRPAKDDPH